MNLLDIPVKVTAKTPSPTPPTVVHKADTVYIQTIAAAQPLTIVNNNYNSNVNTNTVGSGPSHSTEYVIDDEEPIRQRRQVQYYEQPIRPRQGWSGYMNLNISGGRRQQQQVYYPQQPIRTRTMSGGIPAGPTSTGGGLGGIIRTMSGGIRN